MIHINLASPQPSSAYAYVKAWRATPQGKQCRREEARRYRAKRPDIMAKAKANYKASHDPTELRRMDTEAARVRRATPKYKAAQAARNRRFKDAREAGRVAAAGRARPERCELCGEIGEGNTNSVPGIVWDHDHASGAFRGWLCHRCNRALGQVKDSRELLMKMVRYLENGGIK